MTACCTVCWRLLGLRTVPIDSLRAQRPQGCMLECLFSLVPFWVCVLRAGVSLIYAMSLPSYDEIPATLN